MRPRFPCHEHPGVSCIDCRLIMRRDALRVNIYFAVVQFDFTPGTRAGRLIEQTSARRRPARAGTTRLAGPSEGRCAAAAGARPSAHTHCYL